MNSYKNDKYLQNFCLPVLFSSNKIKLYLKKNTANALINFALFQYFLKSNGIWSEFKHQDTQCPTPPQNCGDCNRIKHNASDCNRYLACPNGKICCRVDCCVRSCIVGNPMKSSTNSTKATVR